MALKLLLALASALALSSAATDKVVCYHGIWSTYRQFNGHFGVENIDPTLCTHLIYSFIGVLPDGGIRHIETYLDNNGNINKFNALKQKNKQLKTLVAIGGWNEGTVTFSAISASSAKRATFVQSAVDFVTKWGFDGFDLDWEFPNTFDKANLAQLLKELRAAFDKKGLLLTAAVSATPRSIDNSYDVPSLSQHLDLINVMAYDLHGSWDRKTGQNAPLYASPGESADDQQQLNVDASIRHWIRRGADPQKLTLGLGMYGRTYTLSNPGVNGLGAGSSGDGNQGPYTIQDGVLGYNEIVEKLAEGGWTTVWDDNQKNPYSFKGNQWIGYDNPKSIAAKVEYAKSLNLAGAMIWSIETDDFRGVSGTKFQLLRTINDALGGASVGPVPGPVPEPVPVPVEPEPVPEPVPVPVEAAPAPVAKPGQLCVSEGYVRDPENCSVYHYCLPLNGGFVSFPMSCPSGLVYDQEKVRCDHKENVKC